MGLPVERSALPLNAKFSGSPGVAVPLARLQLLERFSFEYAGVHVALPAALQRLVAFLAVRGPSHRCVIAGTLWPDITETHALGRLRTSMWRMNRLGPGLLIAGGASVRINDAIDVDSRRQEEFATELLRGRVEDGCVIDGLSALLGGCLLPGWYDDWVLFERERLHQLRLHALESASADLLRMGQLPDALQAALEAVRAEPLRETSNVVLISVYLAEGNAVDALRQYDVFRSLLDRELGLAPSPRLERLLQPVRRVTLR